MKLKLILSGCLVCLAAVVGADFIQIDAGRTAGKINHALAGVSQGGNAGSYFKPEIMAGLKKFSPPLVRIEMLTSSLPHQLYNPKTGEFNWEKLDREIEAIQSGGGEVIINFFGTPEHLFSNSEVPVPAFAPPRDFKAYADFCAEIVRHVNVEKKYGVKLWEFWNEPSGNYFWTDWHKGNRSFFELWNEVYRAVKKTDPSVLVGGFGDNSQYPEHYQAWFDSARAARTVPDFLSIHYYGEWAGDDSGIPDNYTRFSDRLLDICRKKIGKTLPVYYTEWNLPAEASGKYPAERVAAWLGASLGKMQENGRINGAAFFRIEHYKDPYSSLFDPAGNPRMAFRILRFFDGLPDQALAVRNDLPGVVVTAAGDKQHVELLISRYDAAKGATSLETGIELSGLSARGDFQMEISRENAQNASRIGEISPERSVVSSSSSGKIRIPLKLDAYETVMIRLQAVDKK